MNRTELILLLSNSTSLVLTNLLDSDSARIERERKRICIDWVMSVVKRCLNHSSHVFHVGSLVSNICLLTSPILSTPATSYFRKSTEINVDICFYLTDTNSTRWFSDVQKSLCESLNGNETCTQTSTSLNKQDSTVNNNNISVASISYFPTDMRLEALVNDITFNIVPNDFVALGFSVILEEFNNKISTDNFFKRCVLLIKAWCLFEAPSFIRFQRSKDDCQTSLDALEILRDEKTIEVMIMWLFNSKLLNEDAFRDILFQVLEGSVSEKNVDYGSGSLQNPFLVLVFFLNFFSEFDWTKWGVSVAGLIPLKPDECIPSQEEKGEGMANNTNDNGVNAMKGMMGQCDASLTAIVTEQRKVLRTKRNTCSRSRSQHTPSTSSISPASYSVLSPSPPPCLTPKGDGHEAENYPRFEQSVSDILSSDPRFLPLSADLESLPPDFKNNHICVLHPLDGSNLCSAPTEDDTGYPKGDFTIQAALRELYGLGFNRLAFFIQSTSVSGVSKVSVDSREIMNETASLAAECFPNLFKASSNTTSTPTPATATALAPTAASTTAESQQGVFSVRGDLHNHKDREPFLEQVLQSSVMSLAIPQEEAISPPAPKDFDKPPLYSTKTETQAPLSAPDAVVGHSGSRTPLGSWGEDAVLTPKILSETAQFYRRSTASSRSSTSPCTRMADQRNFEKATIQALKEDNRKVYYGEVSDSANGRTPPVGSQGAGLRMDSPPVSRGTPPLFVPKVGAFSAKIPSHAIQPFVKKEEQVWVPGKFATDQVAMAGAARDLNSNSSMMSSGLHKDNRGKVTPSNGIAGRTTPSGRSITPVGGGYGDRDRGRISPTMNQGGMGQGPGQGQGMGSSLGPGLLTGKTAIMHSRSCELIGSEGPGGNYPFMSGRSIDNSDVQFDTGDFNASSDRHRANQQALVGRHQLLARHKTASNNSMYGRSTDEQGYHSAVTSGQRSPVTPNMSLSVSQSQSLSQSQSQQRLTPPQSHSSPHLLSNVPPLISNPSFLLSQHQMHTSHSPPYTSNLSPSLPATPYELDHLRKVGFEAQLPSFLREL